LSQPAEVSAPSQWRLETWFSDLDKSVLSNLKKLNDEMIKANRSLNLVAAKTAAFADALHFADSILASKIINSDNPGIDEIYDLGSGNGFPGLVSALLYPKVRHILVEIDEKKCEYLRHCIKVLSLTNTKVSMVNIEAMEPNSVRFGMCRGLSNISKTILMTRRSFVKDATLYHIKSENWSMEVGEIPTQLCSVWSPALVKEYKLPVGEIRFAVVKTDKIS
jgi:16S rRNA (guanine527-N7)-methyltransferase